MTTLARYTFRVVLLLMVSFQALQAQEPLSFRHLDSRQGLSQNSVSAIAQDGDGYMWFGTRAGLNRYDGYRMRTYERGSDSLGALLDDDIRTLYYDAHVNRLWVCTEAGLSVYDPQTDTFETIGFASPGEEGEVNLYPRCILRDQSGYLWVGTGGGLYQFDSTLNQFVSMPRPSEKMGLSGIFDVRALFEDEEGQVWIGSTRGLYLMQPDEEGTPRFRSISKEDSSALFGDRIIFIEQDGEGRLWFGTQKNGLYSWLPGAPPLHHTHSPADPHSLSDNDVRALEVDAQGRVWVGTFLGLHIFNQAEQKFYRYEQEVGNPRSLSSGSVRAICFDTRGSAWVGTYYGGVSYYSPESYRFAHHQPRAGAGELSHAVISSFWEDDAGHVWIGTEGGGINRWDRSRDTYEHYRHISGEAIGLSGNNVKTLVGQGDSLWIGTFATGLNLYRPSLNRWQHFEEGAGGLSNNNVYGLLLHQGQLWISTFGGGLNVMDLTTGEIQVFSHLPPEVDSTSLCSDMARVVMVDLKDRIWVGTREGLDRLDAQDQSQGHFRHFLKGKLITSLWAARDSSIWAGTYQEGVYVLDGSGNLISHYTREGGLPGQTVFGIAEDEKGNVWVSTERGLAKIDRRNDGVMSYNYSDGLDNLEYNFNASYKTRSREMFFGGTRGFTSFSPTLVRTNTFVPPVVLTHLLASNDPVQPGDTRGLLDQSLNDTEQLTFPYNQANFTLGFAALDFLNPANNHYAYQLEGLDQSWKYIQGQGEVSYTLQRAGTYTFRLKGGNNDGVWNQRERQLVITVLPPPWRSPGAYWIYAGLGLVLLLGGYRFIQMRHHLQLEKLTTAQQEALHQAKLRFYTNVTHEFRTPLTLILGPIEDLLRKGVSAGGERQLQAIQHNAKRLLRLVNQLLNFRSLEHNHEQMEVAEGNFVRFAKEVSLSFREQARIKGIDFQFETSSEELRLWYDRDKMEKVFYNLLSNAFKFTPAGGSITFRLTEYETELGVEVRDSGPGIPAKLRLKIFDRYVHQESHAQATLVGTGIGLALAKQLVEMHGGQIWLGDSSTKGACFYVLLPKGKDHYGPQEILSDFKSSENFQAYVEKSTHEAMAKSLFKDRPDPEQPRPKLLVVEDNEQVRSYVQGIFDAYFEVLLGANGQQGLAQAKEHSPDLIISDIMMPKMDGIELCRQLKSQVKTSHIPVILLTARTGQIFRVEGLETGADAYLTKPFSPYELQLKVYNLLEARSRIRERFHSVLKLEPKEITVTSADEAFLTKAIEIVEQYMEDTEFTVEVFAQELAVSRPLLFTKIKAITNQTPNNFVKSLRMKRSAQLLAQSDLGVAEIAYQVGFRDARYFSKCFQKEFGKTPSEFRTISSGQIAEQTTP